MAIETMPTPAGSLGAGDLVQVTVIGDQEGQAIDNVWYVRCSAGSTLTDAAAIAELNVLCSVFHDLMVNDILTRTHLGYTLDQILAKKVQFRSGVAGPARFNYGIQATNFYADQGQIDTFEPLNSFSALTVQLITGETTKFFRGYKRFAGIPEADAEGNVLKLSAWTAWKTSADTWLAHFANYLVNDTASLTWKLVVASLSSPIAPPGSSDDTMVADIAGFKVNRVFGSQLSRKEKRRFA